MTLTKITNGKIHYEEASKRVTTNESRRFMIDCFRACKTPENHAIEMADALVGADYRGHYSHGMNRLEMYLNELNKGTVDGSAVPVLIKETVSTAWVDGRNGLGAVVGNWCMDLAMEKAKKTGIGIVSVKGTNHYGMAGWYTIRAEQNGLMGMSFSNTSPVMAPTRSKEPALGTNPIAFAAPGIDGDSFLLDMATTSVALGKIEMKRRKNERCPIGWAQDEHGVPTTCPQVAWQANCLMPLGGSENTSGYKGYGLSAMVEVLCGVLAGSNFATKVRKWTLDGGDSPADLGQLFLAIDPECFAPGFRYRVSEQNEILRNLEPINPDRPVLVAGDPERTNMAKNDEEGGILYHENQITSCFDLAIRLNVTPMKFLVK